MAEQTKPIVHLFCNAHIDPVWMWGWEEGAREAISTFRTAVNLLDEYPEFVFNHNESLLYEWVEEYDPPLFERIREHVRTGRWNITGGWYLQPDCNLPGGETLVRLIAEGRRYFQEKFGVRPPVSYNFDTFGHPGTLPQLLKQAGFEMYIHCRPPANELVELPDPVRRWEGIDGTQVLGVRPNSGWYCTSEGEAQAQARNGIQIARATGEDVVVTWGLGDHGGGATARDLDLFREIMTEFADSDVEVRHSTPESYLERIKSKFDQYPLYRGEVQRTLMGCYTSVAPIKREMREGEGLMASAEKWAAIAWWLYGYPYPHESLREAWKRLMFNTFHDVLCGSLLEDALPGVHDMYGFAGDVARRVIARNQHYLLPNVPPTPDTIPVYAFNPHSTNMKAPVGLNFLSGYRPPANAKTFQLYDDMGERVDAQASGGHSIVLESGTWQPYIGFVADVPALTARRYEIRFEEPEVRSQNPLEVAENDSGVTVENHWWRVHWDRDLAAPVEITEKASGRNLLKKALQLFAMEDNAHAWGGQTNAIFNIPVSPLTALSAEEVGIFTGSEDKTGPALRVLAAGPVFVLVECLVGWQHTRASIRFKLYRDLPQIDIDTRLYMQARRKMIKLVFPFDLPETRAFCEVPYGEAERQADASEYPCARWIRLESADMTVGIANSGQNGLDVSADGVLGLSLSRGAVHCHWDEEPGGLDTNRSFTWMDQTQVDTCFRLIAGADSQAVAAQLVPLALELNQPFERFFAYFPPSAPEGAPEKPEAFLQVEPATVIIGALKKADQQDALVIRLAETLGKATSATVQLHGDTARQVDFGPYEIKTFLVSRSGDAIKWRESNILEE
ncbi:MAG: hypothetical protein K8L99_07545 [Anaerolineae bacterium]|nr:hypothetical protein [Anaerolineae bacterium]